MTYNAIVLACIIYGALANEQEDISRCASWLLLGPKIESEPEGLGGLAFDATSGTSLTTGPDGLNAWVFTGKNYVRITNSGNLNLAKESFTIATYIYQDTIIDGPIVEWRGTGIAGTHVWISESKHYINLDDVRQFHAALPAKKWSFVGVSFNHKTGNLMMWLDDNVTNKSVGTSAVRDMAGDLYVGVRPSDPNRKFTGKLAGTTLMKCAVNKDQIEELKKIIIIRAKPEICPQTFMSTLKGNFTWPETPAERNATVTCLQVDSGKQLGRPVATRQCIFHKVEGRKWDIPKLDACQYTSTRLGLENLATVTILNQDDVIRVTEMLLADTSNTTLSPEDFSWSADIIDNVLNSKMAFATETTQNHTVVNLSKAIGNLMNGSAATLEKAEEVGTAVSRLVKQVEIISKSLSLFGSGKKTFVTRMLAFAVVDFNNASHGDISIVLYQSEVDEELTTDKVSIQIGGAINESEVNTFLTIPQELRFNEEKASFGLYQRDTLFRAIHRAEQKSTNSHVVVANIGEQVIQNLPTPIRFHFDYNNKDHFNPQCVFWDFALAEWSGAGCRLVTELSEGVSCECDHLTSFALLMDLTGDVGGLDATHMLIQSIMTYVGCTLSLIALLFTVLTHFLFKRELLQNYPPKILMNLSFSIIVTNIIFICSSHYKSDDIYCKVFAMFLHYSILASFCWMTMEAFFMLLAVTVKYRLDNHWANLIKKFAIFGWGFPVLPVVITLGIRRDHYGLQGHEGMCWLQTIPLYAAFVAPACLMLVFNFVVFGVVILKLNSQNENSIRSNQNKRSTRTQLRGAASVVALFGLTWAFGLMIVNSAALVFSYLFIVFNTLQGVFICLFYCLLKKKVTDAWATKCGCKLSKQGTDTSSSIQGKESNLQKTSLG